MKYTEQTNQNKKLADAVFGLAWVYLMSSSGADHSLAKGWSATALMVSPPEHGRMTLL